MKLGAANAVPDCPGWYYGLRILDGNGGCIFDLFKYDGTKIEDVYASCYRTTAMARKMGDRQRDGYEEVAQAVIGTRTPPMHHPVRR